MTVTGTAVFFAGPRRSQPAQQWRQVYVGERRAEVLTLREGEHLLFLHGRG
jgi:hypothetical protein